jgi:hypothetical protein
MQNKYQQFWNWFIDVDQQDPLSFGLNEILKQLKKIDTRLFAQITPIRKNINELMFTTHGDPSLFPTVFELVDVSPQLNGWFFRALRPRSEGDISYKAKGQKIDSKELFFTYQNNDEDKLDLVIYHPYKNTLIDDLFGSLWHLLNSLIGEFDTATKIRYITVERLKDQKGLKPLLSLIDVVPSLKAMYV